MFFKRIRHEKKFQIDNLKKKICRQRLFFTRVLFFRRQITEASEVQ